jgi:hypothetical protein
VIWTCDGSFFVARTKSWPFFCRGCLKRDFRRMDELGFFFAIFVLLPHRSFCLGMFSGFFSSMP